MNMKFTIINGPSLSQLGMREPEIYGKKTLSDLQIMLNKAKADGETLYFVQSNSEGELIDEILWTQHKFTDGLIINPGAYAHYSYAMYDALRAINIPKVEVHLTDIMKREDFRKNLVTAQACDHLIYGHGFDGYVEAMQWIRGELKNDKRRKK
jgi:3-dehydroquinate dehydratase-2